MYVPEWEILADALNRVQATGLDAELAKKSIGWAVADRKIEVRVYCANGWVLEGSYVDVPKRLSPDDFDWPQSRPQKQWRRRPTIADHYEDRNVTINVSLIELRKKDVTRIFCLTTGTGAATAAASTDSIDAQDMTAIEVPRIIKPTADIRAESLVPKSFTADASTTSGAPPPGLVTLRGAIQMIVRGERPDLLAVLGRENADDFIAQVDLGQAALMKQPSDDQVARHRILYDHRRSIALRHHEASRRTLAMIWSADARRLWQAIVIGELPLTAEAPDGILVKPPLLGIRENVLPTVLERDQVVWFDQYAPDQCGVGRPLLAEADVLRWLEGGALVDGPAASAGSRAAFEPSHTGTGRPITQEPDSVPNWRPVLEALEYADSALRDDAWGLMMQWNQAGMLPMQGRADGTTRDFERHWFDYAGQWGCDEPAPMLPTDEMGARPLVGPGRTTSRPRRSALAPRITATIEIPSPLRLYGSDDILWFDQSAARAKGVDLPKTVSNVLVDMTALRRLCTEWRRPDEPDTPAAELDCAPIPNRPGSGGRKMAEAIEAMVAAVDGGPVAYADLRRMKQKELSKLYPDAKRTLLVEARKVALVRLANLGHSDKTAT